MPEYRVTLKSSAEKEFFRLSEPISARIFPKIKALSTDPRPQGCKKLRGGSDAWRIRVGDYRVIYTIDDKEKKVKVTRIGHRREVYE
ncbi:MAG TPA: type II toxin-antitoxin system RelE/ParE family toxin [Terracidiphilus sp.]|nr:type II toxin-antitoxin system RelE/ParE family toxin [Terracidiphilus sp.]